MYQLNLDRGEALSSISLSIERDPPYKILDLFYSKLLYVRFFLCSCYTVIAILQIVLTVVNICVV